jgi:predicted ABC-type ATPase
VHPQKRILIIAGPNGAGKTTFAREFLPNEANCPLFVNADLIAAGLSPFAPERESVAAGKLMLERIRDLVQRGESFGFETTLAGLGYARMIPDWQLKGYDISILFLALPSVEFAIARVAKRVLQGGHSVPEDVIRRRFHAGRQNFDRIYRYAVDHWVLYDASGEQPMPIDTGDNDGR